MMSSGPTILPGLMLLAASCFAQEAALSGRITDAATHQPIEGAQISNRGGRGGKPASVLSDASGAYSIRLPAEERTGLAISKAGYSTLDLRSTDATQIRLHAGDSETRDFEMSKPGSITGHLVDRDSGKPLGGFYVHAIRWYEGAENSTGFRYPAPATSGDGSFAIENLPPANYVLVIDPPMGGKIGVPDPKRKDEGGYGPTWYPGVPQPGMAAPILLGYAENRKLDLRLQKHDLLHISGTFQPPEGMECGSISVTLGTEEKGRPTGAEGEIPRAGPFRIDGLEEGSYRVLASARSKDGQSLFAAKLVALTNHSAEDLRMDLRPGVALRVAITMDDEKSELPARFGFIPESAEWGPLIDENEPPGLSKPYRTGLPAGKYHIALMQMPGYAVVSTAFNGTPVPPGAAVDLESPESVLTYVLTKHVGSVTGIVRNSDQQALPDVMVVLAPEAFVDTGDDYRSLPPGAGEMVLSEGSGRFVFNGLAPGRYRVIALKGKDRLGPVPSELLRERMKTAEGVEVSAGQSASVDVSAK